MGEGGSCVAWHVLCHCSIHTLYPLFEIERKLSKERNFWWFHFVRCCYFLAFRTGWTLRFNLYEVDCSLVPVFLPPLHEEYGLQNMSGRNLCFRAVVRCKSCWFLFNQRLVTPGKVGFNNLCAFQRIVVHSRDSHSVVIDPTSSVHHRTCMQSLRQHVRSNKHLPAFFISINSRGINLLTEYVPWTDY